MRPSPLVGAVAICCALLLSGCGEAPAADAGGATSSASAILAGSGADGDPAGASPLPGDQAPHYAENHRYRERIPVGAAAQRTLDAARERVLARLVALPGPPTEASVAAAVAEGEDEPFVGTAGDGVIGFESAVGGAGCLIGTVPADGAPTVETGGFIMDGGCHALSGH